MRERDQAQAWAVSTKNPEDWLSYKTLRNKVTKILKVEKIQWQKSQLEKCNNDSAKLWANVKGWLSWCRVSSPTRLFSSGSLVTSPQKIATVMNNYYIDKVLKIQENLPPSNTDPLQLLQKLRLGSESVFTLKPVHPDLIYRILGELRNSKATGMDNIDTRALKIVKEEITPAMTHIVNLSIKSSVFPTKWKHAKVIPLPKPGSEDCLAPKSYRPVALLPVVRE